MSKKYLNTKKGSLEESILGLWEKAADEKMEATGDKEKYQKFFKSALKKFGVKSPAELKGEKKREFFDYVDKNYVGDHEESKSVNEASELGTKEDRDEKLNMTPGQSPEDFEKQINAMQEKNNSMRKALADIWGVDEGKNPFDKKEQKKPKKENKKTMTGKPETKVEVDPEIKEKMTIVR